MAVNALGGRAISLTGAQAGILTDRHHAKARIANISPKQIHELLSDDYIVIVAGFQGQTPEGETTTLGRGGSDLTAIALAGALNADACQIFTDVDGVFTCDPRIVKEAKKLDEIAYDELLEMASGGAKVMQSRAVEFAKKFGVEFEVRSSFNKRRGTIAKEESASMEDVRGSRDQPRSPPGETHHRGRARQTRNCGANFLQRRRGAHRRGHDCAKCVDQRNDRRFIHDSRGRTGKRP